MVWEIVFMLLILKIPIVYLCVVVWWAIKAEPAPSDPVNVAVLSDTPPFGGASWRQQASRRRPRRPHTPGRGASPLPRRSGARA
jgi:hypothetical protein